MNVYFPTSKTPEEWREMARECYRRREESWQNSDTDGFLSQWAAEKVAGDYEHLATLSENGGKAQIMGVTDLDGNLLDARQVETQYGWAWMIKHEDGTVSWFNESKARSGEKRRKAHEAKGYRLVWVRHDVLMGFDGHTFPARESVGEVVGEIEYRDY